MAPSAAAMSTMSSNSRASVRLAKVLMTRSPASVRNSPPVRFSDDWRTWLTTPLMRKPWRRSASSLSSICISRSRAPSSDTKETSGSARRASRSASAAWRSSPSSRVGDETASMAALCSGSVRTTSGCSASKGGKFSMRSTAVRTSCTTSTASAKVSSSTVTTPTPSCAVEVTRSTPTMPSRLSSTRRLTSSSTSAGAAPR